MTAPTTSLRLVYAHTTARGGKLHHCSQRDSGALIPLCGAQPIRGRSIATYDAPPVDVVLCSDCAQLKLSSSELQLQNVLASQVAVRAGARAANHALIESVAASGVIVPIIITRTDTGYQLVAGARRLNAAQQAGLTAIPAVIRDSFDPFAALLENLHRTDLNPIEQAHAYSAALPAVGGNKAELARRLGVSRAQVSNTIRLLQLPLEDQARIAAGEVTAEGGRALLARVLQGSSPAAPQLHDVAHLLADLLGVRTRVTGRRISLTVNEQDLPRLLAALRTETAA